MHGIDKCAICKKEIPAVFSLCDDCDSEWGEWDEETDSYTHPDGRVYQFDPSVGEYIQVK